MRKAIILAVQFACLATYAQKVDLDKFYFSASYRDLPRNPLDTSFHTFSVSATTGPLTKFVVKPPELEQRVATELAYGEFHTPDELVEQAVREFLQTRAKIAADQDAYEPLLREGASHEIVTTVPVEEVILELERVADSRI